MIGKKINQLATELAPVSTDLTIIGDPISGVSKKITLAQLGAIFSGAVSFYTNLAGFPATGDINVIYCAKDTQKLYLWSGSAYVEVFPSQALLDTYQLRSEKGNANGYASLDSTGKVPISQLPSSIMEYKGTWNAATNTPTLANGTGDTGDVYICNVAGTVNFGAGPITFAVGDYVIYSGTIWQRSSGAVGTVTSVAATITGNAIGITGSPVTTSGTLAFAFAGTGAQYIKGDGTLATFPSTIAQAERLITEVYNSTGATLTKGTIVYINGGQGNLPTVTKALATGDSTSAQTFGVVQADITNNNNGYVVVAGKLSDLDTQAYTEGTQLYLSSTTAGAWTSTKQYAPAHLVYVGIVVRSHPTQGIVEIKIQNGYEMDELHNVAAQTPSNNDGLFWESATSLWKNKSIATILGGTPVTGSGTLYALTKWGFTSGAIINSNLYDTGSVIYNNNATAGAFAVQFNGNATSGMSYGLLINAGSDANDIALRIQNVSSTSEYFFVYGDGKVKMNNIPNATTDTDTFLVSDGGFIKYRTGAQLLSDIGGQAALTNPVTGTGTTNYLPKFTGTSTIGNSLVYDNGTNVGIGTATPNTPLSIVSSHVSGQSILKIQSATAYSASGLSSIGFNDSDGSRKAIVYTNSDGLQLETSTATPILFNTNGNTRMRLDASGNLGLGNTPDNGYTGYKLQIGSSSDSQTFLSIGNGTTGLGPLNGLVIGNDSTGADIYQRENAPLRFHTNNTEVMRLNASGNLSIGNTNDTYKLDVSGASRILASTYTAGAILYLRDAAATGSNTTFGGLFLGSSPGTDFVLGKQSTNTVGSFAIKTGGGTTLFTLASTGAATFTFDNNSSGVVYSRNVSGTIYELGSVKNSGSDILYQGTGNVFINADSNSDSTASDRNVIFGNRGVEYARITSGGNVGIGTTSPTEKLEVINGSLSVSTNQTGAGIIYGRIAMFSAGAGASYVGYGGEIRSYSVAGIDQSDLRFYTSPNSGATERMRINHIGNVGIGTTSPGARLTVQGSDNSYGSGIRWQHTSSGNYIEAIHGSSNTLYWGYNGSTFLQMVNTSSFNILTTNVGIGTTSPQGKLSIQGSTNNTVIEFDNGGATNAFLRSYDRVSSVYREFTMYATDLMFSTGSSPTERMRITGGSGTDVLIGTTSNPYTASGRACVLLNGSVNSLYGWSVGGSAKGYMYHTGTDVYLENSVSGGFFSITQVGAGYISFNTNGSERARITSGGDICIASTAPVSTRRELRIGGNAAGSRISLGLNGTNYSALVTDSGGNVYLANEYNDSAIKLLMINYNNGVYLSQSATSWTANSDERLKDINGTIKNAVDKLTTLRAVNFSWKSDSNKKEVLGLIAQDVAKVFPQVIDKNKIVNQNESTKDNTEYLGVRYTELVPVLVAAIQELKAELDILKNK